MKKIIIIFPLFFLLTSCFHKSVLKDEADDVLRAQIYDFRDGTCLVTVENIFQATSKKSGRGISITTDHNDLRLATYDIKTGNRIARKSTGTQTKHPIILLGCTEGNIWFYSLDDGLHSRDHQTLEIKVSQDKIIAANPTLKDNLAKCEWHQLNKYFSFSYIDNKMLASDKQGFRYALDPQTLKAEKSPDNFKFPTEFRSVPFTTSASIDLNNFNLSGDLRKQVEYKGKPLNPSLTYLDGKFIVDNNMARVTKSYQDRHVFYKTKSGEFQSEMNEIKAKNGNE